MRLTGRGDAAAGSMRDGYDETARSLLGELSPDECATLGGLLDRVLARLAPPADKERGQEGSRDGEVRG